MLTSEPRSLSITQLLYRGPYRALAERTMIVSVLRLSFLGTKSQRQKKAKFLYLGERYSSTELHKLLAREKVPVTAFRSLLHRITKRLNYEVTEKVEKRLRAYSPKRSHKKPLTTVKADVKMRALLKETPFL